MGVVIRVSALRLTLAAFVCAVTAGCAPDPDATPRPTSPPSPGRLVYLAEPCPTCHGPDRSGTNVGPPVDRLRDRWDERTLAAFLRAPAAVKREDPRLRGISERYRSDMPALFSADTDRVDALVRYLLQE